MKHFRTDLALEAAEPFRKPNTEIEGVSISENYDERNRLRVTDIIVFSEKGAALVGKPMGRYITIESKELGQADEFYHKPITEVMMKQLEKLVPNLFKQKILVAGIGNRQITPDALGPLVVEHLFITRHLIAQYGKNTEWTKGFGNVSAIAPGVMAQTGMESTEILKGIIKQTKPDVLIVIDALAARSMNRLNQTIQMTDTGIWPGAGIGNHRNAFTKEMFNIPVIAIGIPTVIDAATIVTDSLYQIYGQQDFDAQEDFLRLREHMEPLMGDMFVTSKNIDEMIVQMSYTISEAINSLCHEI